MGDRDENLLTSTDKVKGFSDKMLLWKQVVDDGSLEMFSTHPEMVRDPQLEKVSSLNQRLISVQR